MRQASRRVPMNFLCFDLFAGRADEDELFHTLRGFGIVRRCSMVSPQGGHIRTGIKPCQR